MAAYDFHGTVARWRTTPEKFEELWNAPQTEVPNSHGRVRLGKNGKPIKRCRIVFMDELPGVPLMIIGQILRMLQVDLLSRQIILRKTRSTIE